MADLQATLRDAVAAHRSGHKLHAKALYGRVLASEPTNVWANYFCSVLAEEDGNEDQALAFLTRAAETPQPAATVVVAFANRALRDARFQVALEAFCSALQQQPLMTAAATGKALALKRLGRLDEALAASRHALGLRRGWAPGQALPPGQLDPAELETMRRTNRVKLRHDAEQLRRLCAYGAIPDSFRPVADSFEQLAREMPPNLSDTDLITLNEEALVRAQHSYNRLLYLPDLGPPPTPVLNPATEFEIADIAFVENHPRPVVIDDVLAPDALSLLQRFCHDATIWFEVKDHGGHLGAYFEDGLGSPLSVAIAMALKKTLPRTLGKLSLAQLWAYKHVQGGAGTDYHADIGRVSANLWITDDAACLDKNGSGLEIWPVERPHAWGFRQANVDRFEIPSLLSRSSLLPTVVPYRCNRLVLFDANLFHRTSPGDFAPGYEQRRINVTFLFDSTA